MGLTPRLEARPGLRLLSYLSLLPASAVELDATIDRAVVDNPLLERVPWRACPTCGLATAGDRCPACATARWQVEPVAAPDWRTELLGDAAAELPTGLRPALELVVAALDDHGLLPVAPDLDPETLAAVLVGVRTAGPPGIAAASPVDCVRVQAAALVEDGRASALVCEVADHWLPEVAEERYLEVAGALGVHESEVRAAVDVLRADTTPYVALPGGPTRSAPTDVVFTHPDADGPVVAHVADAASAGLGMVPDLLPGSPDARAWLAPHRAAASRLLAAVSARGHMLQRVADQLALRQHDFILHGPSRHLPLRRHEVAVALSVHPSTVGRVVSSKLARCPDGRLVPLPGFFGSVESNRVRVAAALAAHPGATDREVAAVLSREGTTIARRTVAKYRSLAANPASPAR